MTREEMRQFVIDNCLLTGGSVRLSGGGSADFYFDCKRATLSGLFLEPLSDWILSCAEQLTPSAEVIGGPSIGADFIAAATVMRASQRGLPWQHASIVRKEVKRHGTENKIENEPSTPSRILVVEDVITTGGSIARACDEFIESGHVIAGIAAIIDRQAGGMEKLKTRYKAPVFALFSRDDFGELV